MTDKEIALELTKLSIKRANHRLYDGALASRKTQEMVSSNEVQEAFDLHYKALLELKD